MPLRLAPPALPPNVRPIWFPQEINAPLPQHALRIEAPTQLDLDAVNTEVRGMNTTDPGIPTSVVGLYEDKSKNTLGFRWYWDGAGHFVRIQYPKQQLVDPNLANNQDVTVSFTSALGINKSGWIVGRYVAKAKPNNQTVESNGFWLVGGDYHPFPTTFLKDPMNPLRIVRGVSLVGINDDFYVVGSYSFQDEPPGNPLHGFLLKPPISGLDFTNYQVIYFDVEALSVPFGISAAASILNKDTVSVVGWAGNSIAGYLVDGKTIAGVIGGGKNITPANAKATPVVPRGSAVASSSAHGINSDHFVVGWYTPAPLPARLRQLQALSPPEVVEVGFIWRPSGPDPMNNFAYAVLSETAIPAYKTRLMAINNNLWIAGQYTDKKTGTSRGFLLYP
jgi:hypothetical protein